ncbi:MAG TPA: hypothetical protein VKL99_13200 [Candidatus Angelobacter sp.]|nr:hypothetical protein [Candidatus Angelobacter sp.]
MELDKTYIAKLRAQEPETVADFLVRCSLIFAEPKRWVHVPFFWNQREDVIQSALVILLTAIREGKLPQSSKGIHNLINKTFWDLVRWRIYRTRFSALQAA